MSTLGFYALSSLWLLALVPPLVLFYFLKLKRPRLMIPSLALWRRVLEDKRVNSPFQRFKRNILLFLQLLILLLLILAATQPYFRGHDSRKKRLPILLDCSASMAALDKPGGTSRLEAAKREVEKLIDGLLPDQELCIVSFSSTPRRRTDFTDHKRMLRDALAGIQVEDVPSNTEPAMRLLQALAQNVSFDGALLLSDGNVPMSTGVELSFNLEFQRLPAAGPNMGITSFNARRAKGAAAWDVFIEVCATAEVPMPGKVEVRQDGDLLGTQDISADAETPAVVTLRVNAEKKSSLEARVLPDAFDSLASDNTAFLELPVVRQLLVYAPDRLLSYRHAFGALDSVRLLDGSQPPTGDCDLFISDDPDELTQPVGVELLIGVIPADLASSLAFVDEDTEIIDWRRSSPLLRHVQLRDVVLLHQPAFQGSARETDVENQGYEILAHGQKGPLMLRRHTTDGLAYSLLFHTDRSTLPYRVGFPILVANLTDIAMYTAGIAEAGGIATGVLPAMPATPDTEYSVSLPNGEQIAAKSDSTGTLAGIPARQVGVYTVSGPGMQTPLGAGLLNERETSLQAVEQIQFDESLTVAASASPIKSERPLWAPLVLISFLACLLEWWWYQRRAGG